MKRRYLKPETLYKSAKQQLKDLENVRQVIEGRIAQYPEGKIHLIRNKNTVSYYLRINPKDKTGKYISRKDLATIKLYLQKSYDEKTIKIIKNEIYALEKYVKKSGGFYKKMENVYDLFPEKSKTMIVPIAISNQEYIDRWQNKAFLPKYIDDNVLTYQTNKGEIVRSKSEVMIANILNNMKIPYKYECPLTLSGGITIYPDFTILDINRRCEVYWEHRGMMDDRTYANESVKRIREYQKNNIFLGDKLIITEESMKFPLDVVEIKNIIEHYFVKNE